MKTLLSIILMFLFNISYSQVTVKLEGNVYKEVTSSTPKKVSLKNDKLTTNVYQDKKGKKHPVYKSRNGKLFIIIISRNGNEYKKYLNT